MPVFIGTRDPVIDTEDTIVVDTGESVQEEEEAYTRTEDANSPGTPGPLGNNRVNPTGDNMPKGPRSEEPGTDDSVPIAIRRRYRTVASTDFNQGATGTRNSPRLLDKKGGASVSSQTRDQNSDQALYTGPIYGDDIDIADAFTAVEGFVPVLKNTKEALADPIYQAH